MTAILLSKMRLKAKELLLLIFLIGLNPDGGGNYTSLPVRLTLNDLEKLKVSLRATSSNIFKELEKDGVINWNRKNHRIEINSDWIKQQLQQDQNKVLEKFYEILIKQ